MAIECNYGSFLISDNRAKVDIEAVCRLLSETYWAGDRAKEVVEKSTEHSICISALADEKLVGFARVVTDHATFAWIADVIVDPEFRGRGIGKAIMAFIADHPDVPNSRQLLRTDDAHGLYEQFGFERAECMTK